MDAGPLVDRILEDEGLTADLAESEAMSLVSWLVGRAKKLAKEAPTMAEAHRRLNALCQQVGQEVKQLGDGQSITDVLKKCA